MQATQALAGRRDVFSGVYERENKEWEHNCPCSPSRCDEDPGPREPLGGLTGGGYTGRTGMVFTPNKMKM
ncbi:hypothetical protein Ddc_09620 [Ditylenchus destructor]|nr:hypothetical protein Ddc_09620 [Ditylenchus destructor]